MANLCSKINLIKETWNKEKLSMFQNHHGIYSLEIFIFCPSPSHQEVSKEFTTFFLPPIGKIQKMNASLASPFPLKGWVFVWIGWRTPLSLKYATGGILGMLVMTKLQWNPYDYWLLVSVQAYVCLLKSTVSPMELIPGGSVYSRDHHLACAAYDKTLEAWELWFESFNI